MTSLEINYWVTSSAVLHHKLSKFVLVSTRFTMQWWSQFVNCCKYWYYISISHSVRFNLFSRLSRFPSPAVGTNWPFCVDRTPINQSINLFMLMTIRNILLLLLFPMSSVLAGTRYHIQLNCLYGLKCVWVHILFLLFPRFSYTLACR